jgi:hypothetical protein
MKRAPCVVVGGGGVVVVVVAWRVTQARPTRERYEARLSSSDVNLDE